MLVFAFSFISALHATPLRPSDFYDRVGEVDKRLVMGQAALVGAENERAYKTLVTKLLAQTYSPILNRITARIGSLSDETVRDRLLELSATIGDAKTLDVSDTEVFDGKFVLSFGLPKGLPQRGVGVTAYNQAAMRRLLQAVLFVNDFADFENDVPKGCHYLLAQHSFTNSNISLGIRMGNFSLLQAASQLSAEPVAGLSANELMHELLGVGLVTRYALALKPAVLGISGSYYFHKQALVRAANGRLRFSDKLKASLEADADRFAQRPQTNCEHGQGCPVASTGGGQKSALQHYHEAILRIFELTSERD